MGCLFTMEVGQGTNVKGGDHAPTSKGKPLRSWEVMTWYSRILLDCRHPQSRHEPYSWREILSVQLQSDGQLQLLSASRCTYLCVLSVCPHKLNIIFEGKTKKRVFLVCNYQISGKTFGEKLATNSLFFPSNVILSMCGHTESTHRQAHLLALSSCNRPSEWSCTLSISLQKYGSGLD
jgi:hypothetical protein